MKKLIAKLCIWVLNKLGYEADYTKKTEIKITVDASGAIKTLQKIQYQVEQLKKEMHGL